MNMNTVVKLSSIPVISLPGARSFFVTTQSIAICGLGRHQGSSQWGSCNHGLGLGLGPGLGLGVVMGISMGFGGGGGRFHYLWNK